MACGGIFSPLMSTAAAGLLPGAGAIPGIGSALGVNSTLTSALGSFDSLGITSQFSDIITNATDFLGSGTLESLRTLGADIFPALTNAIPGDFSTALNVIAPGGVFDGGFTGLISTTATNLMGGGDLTQFSQIFSQAQGFLGQANQLLNSTLNIDSIAATFGPLNGGMDSLMTGAFSQVNEAFAAFGSDLINLGSLVDMGNLPNLGDPSALVSQLAQVGGMIPGVESALRTAGLDTGQIAQIVSGNLPNLDGTVNRALYEGLTAVTGDELAQVKAILGVNTTGINNMADLLNPQKILPTSWPALTTPTPDGLRGIYTAAGSINTNIEKFLQDPNAPEYTGDDPIVRARLGLPPVSSGTLTT